MALQLLVHFVGAIEHNLLGFVQRARKKLDRCSVENDRARQRCVQSRRLFQILDPRNALACLVTDEECELALGEAPAPPRRT